MGIGKGVGCRVWGVRKTVKKPQTPQTPRTPQTPHTLPPHPTPYTLPCNNN
ncbi:MAG: hypothetical protein F6J93_17795 [Oscillatoria sp. SIO1A7]|nr:hypothetical protein [Oscillatoria sp. SIO1A7]